MSDIQDKRRFINYDTHTETIEPSSLKNINFYGSPNYFVVQNLSNTTLYCSALSTPTKERYEFLVKPFKTRVYTYPYNMKNLMIFNESMEQGKISLTVFEGDFDPLILVQNDIGNEDGSMNVNASINEPIPSGTNNIGHVSIDGTQTVNVQSLPELPSGDNNIGSVNVATLPNVNVATLPSIPTGTNNIGKVDINGTPNVNVSSIPSIPSGTNSIGTVKVDSTIPVEVKQVSYSTYASGKASLTSTYSSIVSSSFSEIVYLANDSTEEISVKIGSGNEFFLAPNESISNLKIVGTLIQAKAITTGSLRFMVM
jgi:hypothetical protein